MQFRFDHLSKDIGEAALGPSGRTVAHAEISSDARYADLRHEPDPARHAERARLGLLGRIAATLCLIELYAHAPGRGEVLACVSKLIAFRQKRARAFQQQRGRAGRGSKPRGTFVEPFLWLITARRPTTVLAELDASPARGWPAGVYFGPGLFRIGIVVASEVPRERSTLLVRLLAAGPLLARAIEDLHGLPRKAHERAVAERILLKLRHVLEKQPSRTPEEKEFIVTMHKTWEDEQEAMRNEGRASAVLIVLQARGLTVPAAARKRILAQKDPKLLERWLKKAAVADSVAEVIKEPSRQPTPSGAARPSR